MIEVRCLHVLAEIETLREEINAVNLSSARPDPFSTFEFYENFIRNEMRFPRWKGFRPWFLLAFEGGQLVGYLALKQFTGKALGLSAPQLDWLTIHVADRPHLVVVEPCAKEVSEVFYQYLLERKQEWSFLEFQQQDTTSTLFPPPVTLDFHGLRVREWPNMDNGNIVVRWKTFDDYFKAFSKKFRSNISRQMRTLFAAGKVEFLLSSDPAITPHLLELYRIAESHSWKSNADAAIDRDPKWVEYYRALLDSGQPMRIWIHVLLLDGVPIAGLINGSFEKALYALRIVYDQRKSRLAPGAAILLMGVRQALTGAYAHFDLLWGFEYYKSRWLADITKTRSVQIYRVGGIFFWRRLLGDWKRSLQRRAQRGPLLFNPARRDFIERENGESEVSTNIDLVSLKTDSEERMQVAELLTEIRKGEYQLHSAAELSASLPFKTRSTSKLKLRQALVSHFGG